VNPHVGGIDIAGLQRDPFPKTQAQGIGGEKKDSVTQPARSAD